MAFELIDESNSCVLPYDAPNPVTIERQNLASNRRELGDPTDSVHTRLIVSMRRACHLVDVHPGASSRDVNRVVRLALRFATLAGRARSAGSETSHRIEELMVPMQEGLAAAGKRLRQPKYPSGKCRRQGSQGLRARPRRRLLLGRPTSQDRSTSRHLLVGLCQAATELASADADAHVGVFELGEAVWGAITASAGGGAPLDGLDARVARHLSLRLAAAGYLLNVSECQDVILSARSTPGGQLNTRDLLVDLADRLTRTRPEDAPMAAMVIPFV